MMAPPIVSAVEATLGADPAERGSSSCRRGAGSSRQSMAEELATSSRIAIICGRYEGIDDRAIEILAPRRSRSATTC